ncbi:MAG: Rieske (2Fe-2S) protein [bacterium]|nr:Rieske (2Fe-2S) protein [bacterium]
MILEKPNEGHSESVPRNWIQEQFDQDPLIQDEIEIEGVAKDEYESIEDPFHTFAFETKSIAKERLAEELAPWLTQPIPQDGYFPTIPIEEIKENVPISLMVFNRRVVIVKYEHSKIVVFDDVCPHAGAILSNGIVEKNTITCIWHGWVFQLDDGSTENHKIARLKIYPYEIRNGILFIGLLLNSQS